MSLRGPFPERQALAITKGVLQALAHIHDLCIIHRDIKLENVVLDIGGNAVVVDFGLSVHLSEKRNLKRKCGSICSVAPEVLLGLGCCAKSDVFGCGTVFYGTLSSKSPFTGTETRITNRTVEETKIVFPEATFANVSPCSRRLIELMLQHRTRHRPSATEAIRELERCAEAVISKEADHLENS
eukprot:TRINITY_DN68971_c0_g1_i1.p1 TRINITY_DN68971_c0_g1~~TRINITY_DN68971_c0_g1_i1.p1  ORF type:complete len:201 (-),score=18.97 TRINITY_DN68971_c0_g1_i1:314-865(-)